MKYVLAIDTSTECATVALKVGDVLEMREQQSPKTHAQFILPLIESLLQASDISLSQLDAIAFGCGPGSFTGLRIACSIAKGLAFAHDLGLIPVSTLSTLAWQARQQQNNLKQPILAVLDARMQEFYWSYIAQDAWEGTEYVGPASSLPTPECSDLIMAGQGIELYWNEVPLLLQQQISLRIPILPKANAMIELAEQAGFIPIAPEDAEPVYVRNNIVNS